MQTGTPPGNINPPPPLKKKFMKTLKMIVRFCDELLVKVYCKSKK